VPNRRELDPNGRQFAEEQDVDMPERPPEAPLPNSSDAAPTTSRPSNSRGPPGHWKPAVSREEIALGETGAGRLLRRVRDRLDASTGPRWLGR